jgi:hypothetical protein
MLTLRQETTAKHHPFGDKPLSLQRQANLNPSSEELGDYVADLQLHMTLQARKLVPNLNAAGDTRTQLLRDTQAEAEKYVSRRSSF